MRLEIQGCLLNSRGTVEGHRVAGKETNLNHIRRGTENMLIRVPGLTWEREITHTMGPS